MRHLYLTPVTRKILFVFSSVLFSIQFLLAQCPAGSVTAVNNQTYGAGLVVCVSGTFNGTITLNNGSQLVVTSTGNYTGRVNSKAGSIITVLAGGTFTPSTANNFAGKLSNAGTAALGSGAAVANGAIFENSGTINFNSGINIYGSNVTITNLDYGNMFFNYNFQLPSGGIFSNNGTLFTKNLTVSSGASFLNRGKTYIIGNLSLNGKLVNNYLVVIKGTTSKQASDSLINYHSMIFDGNADFNGGVRNEGMFWFTSGATKFHNGGLVMNNPSAYIRVNSASFYNNANITAAGVFYSAITPVHSDGSIKGLNGANTLMTNFPSTAITNNAWIPSSNQNIAYNGSSSFPMFDTLNYVATWANPAASFQSALPIVLSGFKAVSQQSSVNISWTTETETNGKYMILQHSVNGNSFTDLATIESKGTAGPASYQYLHTRPYEGLNYYRLKMVSTDDGIKFGQVAVVKIASATRINSSSLRVYPNPFGSQLQVSYSLTKNSPVQVRLINTEGKIVFTKTVLNKTTGNHTMLISTPSGLKSGIYFLEVKTGDELIQQKLLKQ